MAEIFYLNRYRALKSKHQLDYLNHIKDMDNLQLYEEMINFQTERTNTGYLTNSLLEKGLALFPLLHSRANTPELRDLAASYTKHLQHELAHRGGSEYA